MGFGNIWVFFVSVPGPDTAMSELSVLPYGRRAGMSEKGSKQGHQVRIALCVLRHILSREGAQRHFARQKEIPRRKLQVIQVS